MTGAWPRCNECGYEGVYEEIENMDDDEKLLLCEWLAHYFPHAYKLGPMSPEERKFYDAKAKRPE